MDSGTSQRKRKLLVWGLFLLAVCGLVAVQWYARFLDDRAHARWHLALVHREALNQQAAIEANNARDAFLVRSGASEATINDAERLLNGGKPFAQLPGEIHRIWRNAGGGEAILFTGLDGKWRGATHLTFPISSSLWFTSFRSPIAITVEWLSWGVQTSMWSAWAVLLLLCVVYRNKPAIAKYATDWLLAASILVFASSLPEAWIRWGLNFALDGPGLAVVVSAAVWVLHWLFQSLLAEPNPLECQRCGYNLTGNTSGRCPECGRAVEVAPAAE